MLLIFIMGLLFGMIAGIICDKSLTFSFNKLTKYLFKKIRISYFKDSIQTQKSFKIDDKFACGNHHYKVTDIGNRTIVAIQIDEVETITYDKNLKEIKEMLDEEDAERQGWFNGPPYAVSELVFGEYDLEGCHKI